jgi:hypothetical protein
MEQDPQPIITFDFEIQDIRCLHKAMIIFKERWAGGDPREQEHIELLKDAFYRAILEYTYQEVGE